MKKEDIPVTIILTIVALIVLFGMVLTFFEIIDLLYKGLK